MRTIMIIGGKLQGLEAAYLSMKAGMYTIVTDKDPDVPARRICSEFICSNILDREPVWMAAAAKADIILPATENKMVLKWLIRWADQMKIKVAFDMKAFEITSSKRICDELFSENDIPVPAVYPLCKAPYIVKPSEGSGSAGVRICESATEVEKLLCGMNEDKDYVVQEYLAGQGYSVEVIGKPGQYRIYQPATVYVDEVFDRCEAIAPSDLPPSLAAKFRQIALQIAELIKLRGIMDVEAVEENGVLKVLEIDARIPSQTPVAAYHSTGINMMEELYTLFCEEGEWEKRVKEPLPEQVRYACYECIRFEDGKMMHKGEHMIAQTKGVNFYQGIYGADEAMIDAPGTNQWSGIFINAGDTEAALLNKKGNMMKALETQNG